MDHFLRVRCEMVRGKVEDDIIPSEHDKAFFRATRQRGRSDFRLPASAKS
jgi:hypothetical protein